MNVCELYFFFCKFNKFHGEKQNDSEGPEGCDLSLLPKAIIYSHKFTFYENICIAPAHNIPS